MEADTPGTLQLNGNTNLVQFQSISTAYTENYKLARALWYAYFRPEDIRRYVPALEADGIPDVYRRVYSAIAPGDHSGLTALVLSDDLEALDLFDYVVKLPHGNLIAPTRRQGMPALNTSPISGAGMPEGDAITTDDLAADLFSDLAARLDRAIANAGPGTGQWPAAPSHTCAAREETGTALVLRSNELRAARMITPTWHTCPACYHKRVVRIAQQTLFTMATHGAMAWQMLEADEYKRWAQNVRQDRKRSNSDVHYRAHPQDNGTYFVMSTHGLAGDDVPTDKATLYHLLAQYVNTPEGKRASSSHGFGGDYRRLKGDGRQDKGIHLWTDARLEKVAAALGTKVKHSRNTFRLAIDQHDAFQRLADAGIVMRARKGEGDAVAQLADVTNKGQREHKEHCPLFVTDTPPAAALPAMAHLLPPPQYVTDTPLEVLLWPT